MVFKDDIDTWWFARLKEANVNEVLLLAIKIAVVWQTANVLGLFTLSHSSVRSCSASITINATKC